MSSESSEMDYSQMKELAEKASDIVIADFSKQIRGNWKYADHSTTWTTDVKINFGDNGTLTFTEEIPYPFAISLTGNGTYKINRNKMITDLLDRATNSTDYGTSAETFNLASIKSYNDFQRQKLEVTMELEAEVTGKKSEKDYSEKVTTEASVNFENESIELSNQGNFFTQSIGKLIRDDQWRLN